MKKGIGRITGDKSDFASDNLSDTIATEYDDEDSVFEDTLSQSGISQTPNAQTLLTGQDAMTTPPHRRNRQTDHPLSVRIVTSS